LGQLAGDRPSLDHHLQRRRCDRYAHADRHAGTANEHTDQHSDADRHTRATGGYGHADEHADRHAGAANQHTDQHADEYSDADQHGDSDTNGHADGHTDQYADTGYVCAHDRYPPGFGLN
jgi:hypothetical protein